MFKDCLQSGSLLDTSHNNELSATCSFLSKLLRADQTAQRLLFFVDLSLRLTDVDYVKASRTAGGLEKANRGWLATVAPMPHGVSLIPPVRTITPKLRDSRALYLQAVTEANEHYRKQLHRRLLRTHEYKGGRDWGLTEDELSDATGLKRQDINRFLNNHPVSLHVLETIAKITEGVRLPKENEYGDWKRRFIMARVLPHIADTCHTVDENLHLDLNQREEIQHLDELISTIGCVARLDLSDPDAYRECVDRLQGANAGASRARVHLALHWITLRAEMAGFLPRVIRESDDTNKKDIKKRLGILRDLKRAFVKASKRSNGKKVIADVAEQLDRQRDLGKNGVVCLLEECGLQPRDFISLDAKALLAFDTGAQALVAKVVTRPPQFWAPWEDR
jgi:hypothetical protein